MMEKAEFFQEKPNGPISIRVPITFWQGDFEKAVELNEQEHPRDDSFYDNLNPYRQALEDRQCLPKTPQLKSLAGKLHG